MNEELKIIITAVTNTAKKNIKQVSDEVKNLGKQGGSSSASFTKAMSALGKGAAIALGAVVGAITAVSGALIALGKNTAQYRTEQAKLNAAFLASGSSATQAGKTYSNLYRFLGDSGKATEAAAHLAKLTTSEKELAEWTTICQGVYATFGDSLPIEGLTEAANETAKVGKVTGTLADALNWAGVSEDAFNAALEETNSIEQRQALIRNTLNGLYNDAANIYEKNNKDVIAQNEAQARLEATTGRLGNAVVPLLTALSNLSNTLLNALAPAINAVVPLLTALINKLSQATAWVTSFVSALSGGGKAASATEDIADSMGNAAVGAGQLTNNLQGATSAAEKLKRATMGFDELNKVSTGESAAGASAGSIGSIGATSAGSITVETTGLDEALTVSQEKINTFIESVKLKFQEILTIFSPAIEAWSLGLQTVQDAFLASVPNFTAGATSIFEGFSSVGNYLLTDFVPSIVNAFSENLAPVYTDVFGFAIEQAGVNFEWLGGLFEDVCNNILIPALDSFKMVYTDVFSSIGTTWAEYGSSFLAEVDKTIAGVRNSFNIFYENFLKPIFDKVKAVFDSVWKESLKPLVDKAAKAFADIATNLLILYNKTIKPVADWIAQKIYPILVKVIGWIVSQLGSAISSIAGILGGIITVIQGIVQFITGVFTGDWKKAWEGIKNIFKGVWDALYNLVKLPINSCIGAINFLMEAITSGINLVIKALNKISIDIPDWVPGLGGKKFGFDLKELKAPVIPQLAEGGVVKSATVAMIGERGKEAVMPLENNTEWMDLLADRIASKNTSPSRIVLMLDSKELGWANIRSINSITKQTGTLQLALS